MKCEKHGIEMEWRGSLVTGSMHCDWCAAGNDPVAVGTVIHTAAEKGFYFDPGQPQAQPQTPVPCPPQPANPVHMGGFIHPSPATSVVEARERAKQAETMLYTLISGAAYSFCPYCNHTVGSEHTGGGSIVQSAQGRICEQAYHNDVDVIKRGRV
jgi:hypothetical protein